jgi:hypothetical protein
MLAKAAGVRPSSMAAVLAALSALESSAAIPATAPENTVLHVLGRAEEDLDLDLDGWLDELVREEVLVRSRHTRFAGEAELAFRHSLLREGALAMLTAADRVTAHRRAGEWLERAGEEEMALIAEHLDRGGDVAGAITGYLAATRQAVDRCDLPAALQRSDRALALGAKVPQQAELRLLRARAQFAAYALADLRAEFEVALGLPLSELQRVQALLALANVAGGFYVIFWMMDRAGHRRAVHEALGAGRGHRQHGAGRRGAGHDGRAADGAGDADGACESLRAARARRRITLPAASPTAGTSCTSAAIWTKRWSTAGPTKLLCGAPAIRSTRSRSCRATRWCWPPGAATPRRGRCCRRHRDRPTPAGLRGKGGGLRGGILADLGDLDGAATGAEEARQLARERGFVPSQISAAIDLAFIAVRRGNVEQARGHLEEATLHMAAVKGPHEFIFGERLAVARAEVALAAGDAAQALSLADQATLQTAKPPKYRGLALQARALALWRLGRRGEAVVAQRHAVEIARRLDDPALMLRLLTTLLSLDSSDALTAEARAVAERIDAALPDGPLRDRFRASRRART